MNALRPTKRIVLILNDAFSMYQFRRSLIERLVGLGHDVDVIVPPDPYYEKKLSQLGVRCHPVRMERFISPVSDCRLVWLLLRIFRRERYDIVHVMTVKPSIYGTIAASIAGCERIVSLVSGAGFAFADGNGLRHTIVRNLVRLLYAFSMKRVRRVWFQNADDLALFQREGIVTAEQSVVIRGSGVDMGEYSQDAVGDEERRELREQLGIGTAPVAMLVAARMIRSKGVEVLIRAALQLRDSYPVWRFVVVAPFDRESPDQVSDDLLDLGREAGIVFVTSFQKDIRRYHALASIAVLPSFYPEGVPRSLLEAMSMGLPIVTTEQPGCKETVVDGLNGYRVTARDVDVLADRLSRLMGDPDLRSRMGRESRALCAREYDHRIVVSRVIQEVYDLRLGTC